MSLSRITITEQEGSNRISTSNDNKSGLLFYSASATPLSVQIFSLSEAEAEGITADTFPVLHYHISEFYRINPSGQLQVKVVALTGGTPSFQEVKALVADTEGDLMQIGVYTQSMFSTSMVTALQSVLTELKGEDIPLVALLQANFAEETLSGLADLSSSNANQVAVLIGQDGNGRGAELFNQLGYSIGILGATLGAVAKSSVHESISWKAVFDMSGAELNTLAFANGTQYKLVTKSQLAQLNDRKYVFLLKDYGLNGSFFNSSFVATSQSSDFYSIERNRTINKSRKLLRTALLPELNSPLYLDESGSLRIETIGKFTSKCEQALDGMKRAGELSNYSIQIDANQNVLSDDTLRISVKLQPVGVARFIDITLSFAVSVA